MQIDKKYLQKCEVPGHDESKKEYFCTDCKTFLCSKCFPLHTGHRFYLYMDYIKLSLNDITEKRGKLSDFIDHLKSAIQSIEYEKQQAISYINQSKDKLQKSFLELVRKAQSGIENHSDAKILEVEQKYSAKMMVIAQILEKATIEIYKLGRVEKEVNDFNGEDLTAKLDAENVTKILGSIKNEDFANLIEEFKKLKEQHAEENKETESCIRNIPFDRISKIKALLDEYKAYKENAEKAMSELAFEKKNKEKIITDFAKEKDELCAKFNQEKMDWENILKNLKKNFEGRLNEVSIQTTNLTNRLNSEMTNNATLITQLTEKSSQITNWDKEPAFFKKPTKNK